MGEIGMTSPSAIPEAMVRPERHSVSVKCRLAKKKPMVTAKLADYGVEPQPVIKEISVTLPPARAAGQIVADIPTLVKKLAEEAKVI